MKGYIKYQVNGLTFKREYIRNFNDLTQVDIFMKYINFRKGIIKEEMYNVSLVFKGKVIAGNKDAAIC